MNVSLVRPAIFLGGCGIEKGHPWIPMVAGICDKFRNHQGLFRRDLFSCTKKHKRKFHRGSFAMQSFQPAVQQTLGEICWGCFAWKVLVFESVTTHPVRGILELNLEVIAVAEHGGFLCGVYILQISFMIQVHEGSIE